MKYKIAIEVDLLEFEPSGGTHDEIKAFIISSILQPARAHAQMRRRLPEIFETAGEEVFINRVTLIDQAKESLVVTVIDEHWCHAFNDWS